MRTYTIGFKEYDDADNAERHLSALFFDMCADCGIDYGDDSVAWRECFNDWTDSLNKDRILCDDAYNDLCPVGDRFE